MTKKATKMIKTIASVIMAMALLFTMAAPVAFAGNQPTSGYGSPSDPIQAAVTKKLVMPANTETPAVTFTFDFAAKALNDDTSSTAKAKLPAMGPMSITFAATDVGTTADGIKTVILESTNILAGKNFSDVGLYKYTVTENQSAPVNTSTTQYQLSKAEYEFIVVVEQDDTNKNFYVSNVHCIKIINDEQISTPGEGKGSPTISGKRTEDEKLVSLWSEMVFMNKLVKNNGGTDPNADSTLAVSKAVTGTFGSQTEKFKIEVSVGRPKVDVNPATYYHAYILNSDNSKVTSNDYGLPMSSATGTEGMIQFTPDAAATTIYLQSGQRLSFIDMPVGATFTVKEDGVANYTSTAVLTIGGNEVTGLHVNNTAANTTLTIPTVTSPLTMIYTGEGKKTNIAAITNRYADVSDTGIIVDNLPYITMIAMVLIALAAYVAFKSYKGAKSNIN